MVALREYPVPKTQLDSAIFEVAEESEYRSVAESFKHPLAAATPIATNSSGFSSSSLLQLVRQRDFANANYVRTEMIQHHLPITPDHAFIWPALHVANSPSDPGVRLENFCGWISLLPAADEESRGRPMFGRLMHSLSHNPQADVELIMAFVRMCILKGYMVKVPDQMIPLVVRFAPPSVSLRFLEDLLYLVVERFTLDKQMKRKIRFWCKTAMTGYLGVGLAEEASKVFRIGLQYGLSLPRVPSRWLRKAVAKDYDRLELSQEATAALKRPKVRLSRYRGPSFFPGLIPDAPSDLTPLGSNTDPSGQGALLTRIWGDVRSVKPPDPLDVARFLEIFDSRPTTIQLLAAYNQRKPARYRGQWILGELLYYARRKEWRELIGAFDTYFFRVGVPANIDEHKLQGRVTTPCVQQRLFPSPYHTSLVWMALVEIFRTARPVATLFRELVEQAEASKTGGRSRVGVLLVPMRAGTFDAGHFSPFFVAAYRQRRWKRLVGEFAEMSRLGIEPRVEQLSLLAGAFAGMARGHEAICTLDKMEDVLKEKGTNRSWRPHGLPEGVALYLPALRRFIDRKDTSGASLVRQRILGGGYMNGADPHVDRVLAKLEVPIPINDKLVSRKKHFSSDGSDNPRSALGHFGRYQALAHPACGHWPTHGIGTSRT